VSWFALRFGWTPEQVRRLTLREMRLLNEAMSSADLARSAGMG
jgi:hypothetical protein